MTTQSHPLATSTIETLAELKSALKVQVREAVAAGLCGASIFRVECEIALDSPLEFLSRIRADRKFFWRSGGVEIAAAGVAEQISGDGVSDAHRMMAHIGERMRSCDSNVRYYGGFRFDRFDGAKPLSSEWQAFGNAQMFMPVMEIVRTTRATTAAMQLVVDPAGDLPLESRLAILDGIGEDDAAEHASCTVVSKTLSPTRDEWEQIVSKALTSIASATLKKVVLARRVSCTLDYPADVFELALKVYRQDGAATVFSMQMSPGLGFFGGTPEHLFTRSGREVLSEALAGTRPYGDDFVRDFRAAVELLTSDKELREVELVREAIEAAMRPLSEELDTYEEPYVHRAGTVQHLRYPINGTLKSGISDADLLTALSPTPAVCGTPDETAIQQIRACEQFDRGWYAGPIGWVAKDAAEFVVAIRSALVDDRTIHLYSGVGIVEGSQPETEWNELDSKVAGLLRKLEA